MSSSELNLEDAATSATEKEKCSKASYEYFQEGIYCNATYDDVHCWPPTPAGSIATETCATIFPKFDSMAKFPEAFAFRECELDGQWHNNWTNYSQCVELVDMFEPEDDTFKNAVSYIMFFGGLVSFSLLALTLFIFTCFRSLKCDRLRVHRNLVCSLLVRFFVILIFSEPFITGRKNGTYRNADWACKTLLVIIMYTQLASINWMFVEGLFLHSRLTSNVFDSKAPFKIYYSIGWGLPLVFITWWVVDMSSSNLEQCWRSYISRSSTWILVSPMMIVLVVNLFFLINILRILVTKLRASQAVEATQVRKAVRAAFVLLPLLGIPNLVFVVTPEKGGIEGIYMVASAFFQSSQGVFVSILHCFCNGEVQDLFKKRWRRMRAPHLHNFCSARYNGTKSVIITPTFSELQCVTAENDGSKLSCTEMQNTPSLKKS